MSDNVELSIVLKLKGQNICLTPAEARDLLEQLKTVVGEKTFIPMSPVSPLPHPDTGPWLRTWPEVWPGTGTGAPPVTITYGSAGK